jgi:hypothetical protein
MLKFLRKYNTLILVVGGSLLMVVFLVPQAIEQIGRNPANIAYAEVEGETLSMEDVSGVRDSWQMINQLVPEIVAFMQIEGLDHWLLLTREATQNGLIGGPTDGASSFGFFADVYGQTVVNPWGFQSTQQYLDQVQVEADNYRALMTDRLERQTATGRSEIVYFQALAKLRGVTRLLQTNSSLAGLSIPETQLAAADLFDRVTVTLGIVPASAFRPDPSTLELEDVRAHFEAYRETAPGQGDFGFGYLLPDAVKFEWIRVNASAITQSIQASPADELEYYRRNEDRYLGQSFEEVRQRVRTDYVNSIARQRLDAIAKEIQREQLRSAQSLPEDTQNSRYRLVPGDWTGPELETYADKVRSAAGLEGDASTDLLTLGDSTDAFKSSSDIQSSPIGRSRYEFTATEVIPLPQLLLSAKEFGGDERHDLQRGLLFGPLRPSGQGPRDLVFVRITDVRPEGPAQSLELVEEQVREDLATLRGFEELTARADTFRAAFADGGLNWFNDMDFSNSADARQYLGAVIGYDTVQSDVGNPLPQLSNSALPEAVIDHARTLDPTQPLSDVPTDDRTTSALLPDQLALGLATIESFRPATVDRMRDGMARIEQRVRQQAQSVSNQPVYTFDAMAERMNFKLLDRDDEDI